MPDLTWTRCSDRWPPAVASNVAVIRHGFCQPRLACVDGTAKLWICRGYAKPIHPDDLYLILPAVPEEAPSTSTPS